MSAIVSRGIRRSSSALAARSARTGISTRARAMSSAGEGATVGTPWAAGMVIRAFSQLPLFLIVARMERSVLRGFRAPIVLHRIARCALHPGYSCPISEQLEIFLLLPLGDLGVVARELGLLDGQVIVDELPTEGIGEAAILAQRRQRLFERLGQERRLGLIGRIRRRSRIELAREPVAP